MIFFNRYLNTATAEAAATTVNPAELLARHGVKTDETMVGDQVPDIKTQNSEEKPAPPAVAAATPAPTQPDKPAAPADPKPDPVKPETPNWQQFLKNAPKPEVLKALGYNDKLVGLLNRWESGGSLQEYIEATSLDYSKMSAEDVMRHHLKQEYPELSKEDFEELYRMNVTEHYKLDPDMFSEQEVKRGNILLNAASKKVREGLIQKQQEYIIPKAPENKPLTKEDYYKEQEAEAQQSFEKYKATMEAAPVISEFAKSKTVQVGEGEDRFNYTVENADDLLGLLYERSKWQQAMQNEDGSPKADVQLLVSALAHNPKNFISELGKHFMALGAKRAFAEVENAIPPGGSTTRPDTLELSPAAALAKGGVITGGA